MSLLDIEFKYRLNRVLRRAEEYFGDDIRLASVTTSFPSWVTDLYNRLVNEYGTSDISYILPEVMALPDSVRPIFQSYVVYTRVRSAQEPAEVSSDFNTTPPAADLPTDAGAGGDDNNTQDAGGQESVLDKLLGKLVDTQNSFPGESNAVLLSDIKSYKNMHPDASPEDVYVWLIDPTREDHWSEPYLLEQFGFDKNNVIAFIRRVLTNGE